MAQGDPIAKLKAAELRRFLGENDGRRTVLVRIETPTPSIGLEADRVSRKLRTKKAGRDSNEDVGEAVERVRSLLEDLTRTAPTWIGAAKAFVVTVDPEQLRTIADSPLVRAIYPNRRL